MQLSGHPMLRSSRRRTRHRGGGKSFRRRGCRGACRQTQQRRSGRQSKRAKRYLWALPGLHSRPCPSIPRMLYRRSRILFPRRKNFAVPCLCCLTVTTADHSIQIVFSDMHGATHRRLSV
jgi:hypothetical protein